MCGRRRADPFARPIEITRTLRNDAFQFAQCYGRFDKWVGGRHLLNTILILGMHGWLSYKLSYKPRSVPR